MAKASPIHVGRKFVLLTVVAIGGTDGHGHRYHSCVCSCRPDAKPRQYREDFLRGGRVKSCGCLRAKTQWNFGTKPRKRRQNANGVGETKPPEVQQTKPDIEIDHANVLRAKAQARRDAIAAFRAAVDRLVAANKLSNDAVPQLTNQQVLCLLIDDDPPNSSLPKSLQKTALAIAQKLWNKILVDESRSMSRGAFMPSAEAGRGLLVTGGYDPAHIDEVTAHPNDGSGKRVRPEGNGPDKFSSNHETNGANYSDPDPDYEEIVDAAAEAEGEMPRPIFCTTASERVYITTSSDKDANGGS